MGKRLVTIDDDDDRVRLLAHRLAGHSLHTASTALDSFDAALIGFRDSGPGTAAASLSLRCGIANSRRANRNDELARVLSWRGAPHLHRRSDLGLIRAAMASADSADLAAVVGEVPDHVAGLADPIGQIATVMGDHFDSLETDATVTKGELSTAVTSSVDPVLVSPCQRCGTDHVNDAMFRLATLRAGIEVDPAATTQTYTRRRSVDGVLPSDHDRATARSQVVAVAASISVATDTTSLAAWLGWDTGSVARAIGEPVPPARRSRTTRNVRLLPSRDPWLSGSERPWLLGDHVDRRKDVFRSLGAPGIVLADGEIIGTWRQRVQKTRLEIEIDAWRRLSRSERDELDDDASTVADTRSLDPHLVLST